MGFRAKCTKVRGVPALRHLGQRGLSRLRANLELVRVMKQYGAQPLRLIRAIYIFGRSLLIEAIQQLLHDVSRYLVGGG